MNKKLSALLFAIVTLLMWLPPNPAGAASSTSFSYQGRLNEGPAPVSGSFEFRLVVFDLPEAGTQVAGPITRPCVVSNGLFALDLDFGPGVFTGSARWLQLAVRTNGALDYVTLSPRQPITPAPYAVYAHSAGTPGLHTHSAGDIVSGSLDTARLNVGTIAGTVAAGNHAHPGVYYTQAEVDAMLAELASRLAILEPTVFTGVPPPPTSLAAAAMSPTAIALQWQYMSTPLETGFRVERQSGDKPDFVEVATIPADVTSYTNTGLIPATTYTYRVRAYNAAGNSGYAGPSSATTLVQSNTCNNTLAILLADPELVHAAAPFQVRIFTHGLSPTNPAAELKLISSDATEISLGFTTIASPNELVATIPAALPAGPRTLRVVAQNGDCGTLADGLRIVSAQDISQLQASPGNVSTSAPTTITLTAAGSPVGFQQNARAFVAPASGGLATPLDSVLFASSSQLNATVPVGLTPGAYHVMVINPDGTAGLLNSGLNVLWGELPVIQSVSPYVVAAAGQQFVVKGQGFNTPQVSLICRSPGGPSYEVTAAVLAWDSASIIASFAASTPTPGSVCVVKVVNADGGSALFSSLAAANGSLSENPWSTGPSLLMARRAPSVASVRRSSTEGLLLAIGGDNGAPAGALSTIESASLDQFGQPGSWTGQRNALPAGRTFAGAVAIGQFVYLVGGDSGAGPVSSVLRARILDVAPVPAAPVCSLEMDEALPTNSLAGGITQYRISTIFAGNDEGLPGGISTLRVPAMPKLAMRLSWSAVAGATGYRVYRGTGDGSFSMIGEVLAAVTSFTDTGLASIPGQQPLPPGSLGIWQTAPSLSVARARHAVLAVARPGTPGQNFLFAIGGRGPGGTWLTSVESLAVNDDGSTGMWSTAASLLSVARAELGGWALSAADASQIPSGEYWLYVGPGTSGAGSWSSAVDAARVTAAGLQSFTTATSLTGSVAGYGALVGKGRVCVAGGLGGASALMKTASPTSVFPGLPPWSTSPQALTQPRIYCGAAQLGAVLYIVGGASSGGAPLSSTETATR